ncbi:MAG: endonuclease/exonuclease/phosphatase family protein [Candidatus Omnitrophica bacterium]|nr:endonuclease/exonuclease/phosphatase family protein [Candidatus Omnitrophota bacterium]
MGSVTTLAILRGIAGLASLATVMGLLARWSWLCELASHFCVQYVWILSLSGIALLILRQVPEGLFAISMALLNLLAITPLHRRAPTRKAARTYRALMANVLSGNQAHDKVHRLLRETQPDVVVLVEINERWLEALQPLTDTYTFTNHVLLPGGFGIVLLSRVPVERTQIVRLRATGLPLLVVGLMLQDQRVTIIGTHPVAPTNPFRTKHRNQHLADLAEFVLVQNRPTMVLGDLNTTSWSPGFQHLMRRARLRDSRVGFGVQPSWPSMAPSPLRIPIDHCLVSHHIIVHQRRIGPHIGSDHYPIIVDFSVL